MNHNMSIYRQLSPKLLVQIGVGLGLLHWTHMSNISLSVSNAKDCVAKCRNKISTFSEQQC